MGRAYAPRVRTWGTTPADEALPWDCDRVLPDATHAYLRATEVDAPAATTFRWLCQLRVAPYSYDLIDNLGRRSPRELTPGTDDLRVGQRMVGVFRLAAVEPGTSLTIAVSACAMTYRVQALPGDRSRIVAKVAFRAPGPAPVRALAGWALGWGDLVMIRRQLLNLAALAAGRQP